MKCCCADLGDTFYLEEAPADFEAHLEKLAHGDWTTLSKCRVCGALWAIDAWDKYSDQVAARVFAIDDWKSASESQRKQLLLHSRGGETKDKCVWRGCSGFAVKGSAYCIDHLYETGARK